MTNELNKLGLPVRHSNCLAGAGVKTFNQLLNVSVAELKGIPDMGAKGIEYVLALVASRGHKLEGQVIYEELKARKKAKRKWVGLSMEQFIYFTHYVKAEDLMEIEKALMDNNT